MNALLLSAGLGTRLRPMTDTLAKPAIPFLGVPLLGYMLYHLEQLPLKNLVFNTHHLPETVEAAARKLTAGRPLTSGQKYNVHFSHEPILLGSGGGIKKAEKFLRGSDYFVVANADEFLLFNHAEGLKPLVDYHIKNGALATLLTTDHPEAGRTLGGVWVSGAAAAASERKSPVTSLSGMGPITRLGGTHSEPGAKHFTGVFVFSDRVFDYMPLTGGEFHIFKDCLHKAMAAGEKVLSYHDPDLYWLDMSSVSDFERSVVAAHKLLKDSSASPTRFGQNLEKILKHYKV